MQTKTVHNISLIQNNIKITSIATFLGPTWLSSGHTRGIRPAGGNIHTKGPQTWTKQRENNAERKESFILKQTHFSVNSNITVAWKYIDLGQFQKVNSCLKVAKWCRNI
jgi:hypothetical protein